MPDGYRAIIEHAKRLSVNFRFEEGSASLDNKEQVEIIKGLAGLQGGVLNAGGLVDA